jgi:hypothetical protein
MKKINIKLSRCPNGTRRNKLTKICESKQIKPNKPVTQNKQSKPNKPDAQNIKRIRCPNGTRRNKLTKICEPKNKTIKNKSYIPTLNNKLITLLNTNGKTPNIYKELFGCNSEIQLSHLNYEKLKDVLIKNKNDKCISAFSKEGQNILLNNLKLLNKINCKNIIVPKQELTNCWFNTFIMSFFVSDKGRRFFRYFREFMIRGRTMDNKLIKPKQLRMAFMLLNIAIDSIYNHDNNNIDLKLALNTNTIIKHIYNSLKKKYQYPNIKNISQYGNPLSYYNDIMSYISARNIIKIEYVGINDLEHTVFSNNYIPQLIILSQYDKDVRKNLNNIITKNGIKYKLDSIIIRNISKCHFISCFTCNNEKYIYDGASEKKLFNIDWIKLLNSNTKWSVNKSLYNFFNCYAIYFYYRL